MATTRSTVSALIACVFAAAAAWSPPTASAQWQEVDKVTASNASFLGLFGTGVSISGNYAVGGGIGGAGSANVFEYNGTQWQEVALLTASDGMNGDSFGLGVSIDGGLIVVGAMWNDHAGGDSGAAYVFELVAGSWQEVAKLTASDAAAGAEFGQSVSISGQRVVVGAPKTAQRGVGAGAVYVFERVGGVWQETARLTASDVADGDHFGWDVALDGDTIIVGAPYSDDNGEDSGSAYVFELVGGFWQEVAKLTSDDAAAGDLFGFNVDVHGVSAIVGALADDIVFEDTGSAYVFGRAGGSWQQVQKLVAADPGFQDQFGRSVAIGNGVAIVGANFEDQLGFTAGAAYLYELSDGQWVQSSKLLASDGTANAQFGCSVSISGNRAAIGALGDPGAVFFGGAMYLFAAPCPASDLNGDGAVDLADLSILLSDYGCTGGGCDGDLNGDGNTDLADLSEFLADFGVPCG